MKFKKMTGAQCKALHAAEKLFLFPDVVDLDILVLQTCLHLQNRTGTFGSMCRVDRDAIHPSPLFQHIQGLCSFTFHSIIFQNSQCNLISSDFCVLLRMFITLLRTTSRQGTFLCWSSPDSLRELLKRTSHRPCWLSPKKMLCFIQVQAIVYSL